jgi:hypothetical protein
MSTMMIAGTCTINLIFNCTIVSIVYLLVHAPLKDNAVSNQLPKLLTYPGVYTGIYERGLTVAPMAYGRQKRDCS